MNSSSTGDAGVAPEAAEPARSDEPRDRARAAPVPIVRVRDDDETFAGFGVMGLPFASGDVLALRRFAASSIGPGYTSVWHRTPEGRWTMYTDVPAAQACPRFFGAALERAVQVPIELEWVGPRVLRVHIDAGRVLDWRMVLAPTSATRAMNAMSRWMPAAAWRSPAVLGAMSRLAGAMLDVGAVRLAGRAPNGQRFVANPVEVWMVTESGATVEGRALGAPGPVSPQARLGDFWIPQRGVFAIGRAAFERFDPARHDARTGA